MITSFSPFSFFPRSVVGMISRACCAVACLAMRSDIKKSVERANEKRRSPARTHHRAHHHKVGGGGGGDDDEFIPAFPGDNGTSQGRAADERQQHRGSKLAHWCRLRCRRGGK